MRKYEGIEVKTVKTMDALYLNILTYITRCVLNHSFIGIKQPNQLFLKINLKYRKIINNSYSMPTIFQMKNHISTIVSEQFPCY